MSDYGQLQPDETLDDRGVDDVLDEGYSPPEKLRGSNAKSVTSYGEEQGETIDERLAQEEPEADPYDEQQEDDPVRIEDDPAPPGTVGDERAGRLVDPDQGLGEDTEKDLVGTDVGIDGGAAGAEEAAMHVIDEVPDQD